MRWRNRLRSGIIVPFVYYILSYCVDIRLVLFYFYARVIKELKEQNTETNFSTVYYYYYL